MRIKARISVANLRNIEYMVQEAFTGIRRNGLMAFASITTIALSLGVLGAFILGALAANNFTAAQIGKFQIAVFMANQAGDKRTQEVADEIRSMRGVESVTVRSRDKEWQQFKLEHPDIESAGLPLNVLPYSMDVKISDTSRITLIASKIRKMENVDSVKEGRETLDRVMSIARVMKGISILGALILLITTAFIISNAIRLTLYARRQEIRIMQLVGATNEFIRVPLVIEGIVFGILGSLLASFLLRLGAIYLSHEAKNILPMLTRWSSGVQPAQLAIGLMIVGAAIGAAGSILSMRRFLHD